MNLKTSITVVEWHHQWLLPCQLPISGRCLQISMLLYDSIVNMPLYLVGIVLRTPCWQVDGARSTSIVYKCIMVVNSSLLFWLSWLHLMFYHEDGTSVLILSRISQLLLAVTSACLPCCLNKANFWFDFDATCLAFVIYSAVWSNSFWSWYCGYRVRTFSVWSSSTTAPCSAFANVQRVAS